MTGRTSLPILIAGAGDLAWRVTERMSRYNDLEIVLAGRRAIEGAAAARLLSTCGQARVRFVEIDLSMSAAVERLLRKERPALIVHCASLLSPWRLGARHDPIAATIARAGFALQLPAQLPLIQSLMRGVESTGYSGPVVNCSYPDVVNTILARTLRAPTIGIGNAAMIRAIVAARLRDGGGEPPLVRILAHHAHVRGVVLGVPPADARLRARVYIGDSAEDRSDLAYGSGALESSVRLNSLSAACAEPVIRALLPAGEPIRTSTPGPLGLPGGYPVTISRDSIALDLPSSVSPEEAVAFQNRSAELDGIARIDENGVVYFTERVHELLGATHPELCEPLPPGDAAQRFDRLQSALGS